MAQVQVVRWARWRPRTQPPQTAWYAPTKPERPKYYSRATLCEAVNGPTLSQFTLHKSTSESPLFSQASFSLHADSKRVALCLGQGDDAQLNRSQLNRTAAGVRGGAPAGAVASAEADLGDEDGVTLSDFRRWLVLEENWQSAEETRQLYMEGHQFKKERDDRHRERGMERQAASIEQMKVAKGRVEEHREHNLEQGKVVREDVVDWKQQMISHQEAWISRAKEVRDKTVKSERAREEKKKLLEEKKAHSKRVKEELTTMLKSGQDARLEYAKKVREHATKIRNETSDKVTDEARKIFYNQRKKVADDVQQEVKLWEDARNANRKVFREKLQLGREKARGMEGNARGARKALMAEKAREAAELHKQKA